MNIKSSLSGFVSLNFCCAWELFLLKDFVNHKLRFKKEEEEKRPRVFDGTERNPEVWPVLLPTIEQKPTNCQIVLINYQFPLNWNPPTQSQILRLFCGCRKNCVIKWNFVELRHALLGLWMASSSMNGSSWMSQLAGPSLVSFVGNFYCFDNLTIDCELNKSSIKL